MSTRHIELDALHWGPDWTPNEDFADRVRQAIAAESWTLCGNYAPVRDMIYARADTVIWLDYPMSTVFMRVLRRTLLRSIGRQPLWAGNRESLWLAFCSRESILLWVITTWRRRRRDYPRMFASPMCRHLRVIRFRTPAQTQRWLDHLSEEAG
jgi:adenylate kinase family enzyme